MASPRPLPPAGLIGSFAPHPQASYHLLDLGTGTAERFTALWQHASGTLFHPWADVVTIIGFLDDLRDDWGPERLLIEDMLARAVAELGGTSR